MQDLATRLQSLSVVTFVFVSLFALGLDLTIRQILDPLRDRWMLTRSLSANLLIVPAFAFVLTLLIPLDPSTRLGLLLYACCSGSEGAPKFVHIAGGNAAFAVALLGFLLLATVLAVPLLLSLGFPDVHIEQGKLLLKLLAIVALPMATGLSIRAKREMLAQRLSPVMHRISSALLLLAFSLIIYVNFAKILEMQSATLTAGLLLFFFASVAGYLLGGPVRTNSRALALMTLVRGGSIAMVIAGQAFPSDPQILVTATVMTAISVVLVVPSALALRRLAI